MKKVISTEKRPIKMWLDEIEDNALEQAKRLANSPSIFKHIALMSDAHMGYGACIGSVFATKDVIIPNAVGKDIACGIVAVKTSLTEIDTETLKKIMNDVRKVIPVGFGKNHEKQQNEKLMPEIVYNTNKEEEFKKQFPICYQQYQKALFALVTCGSGNHFEEIQKGDDGHIWIMIHSGSRNLGSKVADHYGKLAYELNLKWHSNTYLENLNDSLAFLPVNSEEGQAYIREMNYCVEYAYANRKLMMDRIKDCFQEHIKDVGFNPMINIAHNYASQENHFDKNVWVHRKGATLARKETIGIIPGSQGTSSYIVEGLGNPDSFESCSHGAGRLMGRKQAIRELDLEKEIKTLDDQGIIHGIRHAKDLEEAVSCYKDIDLVMSQQEDLIKILVKLKPLAVIKG